MDPTLRQQLEHVADELHPLRDTQPTIESAHTDVRDALDTESTEGLGERLDRHAVELETSHPAISTLIRTLVSELTSMGI